MRTSKAALIVSAVLGKIFSICGYVVGIPVLIALSSSVVDRDGLSPEATMAGVIFLALSVLAVAKGMQIKRRIRRFKRYVRLISAQRLTSIEKLAAETGKPFAFVYKDLQKMIKRKYFVNAAIDAEKKQISIGDKGASGHIPSGARMKVVDCVNCGANNIAIAGRITQCEYCGSYLSADR